MNNYAPKVISWNEWDHSAVDHSTPEYQRGLKIMRERKRIAKLREEHPERFCKACGAELPANNHCGWCSVCKIQHEAEIQRNRRAKISQTKKERKMKNKYMVYTDHGDYAIWAKSAEDAADIVSKLNYCRVKICSVERCF